MTSPPRPRPQITLSCRAVETRHHRSAPAGGYNWGATTEAGEPVHAGGAGCASVWYSWTPPAGEASLSLHGARRPTAAVYTGIGRPALTPVAASAEPARLVAADADRRRGIPASPSTAADVEGRRWMGDFDLR